MNQVAAVLRRVVLLACLGLAVTTTATFGWGLARAIEMVGDLLGGAWRGDGPIVDLLKVIDLFLLGTVQLITVFGLYELFIGDLDVPEPLRIRSLGELKHALIEVFVVFLAVKFIEKLIQVDDPGKALRYAGAVALVIGALAVFANVRVSLGGGDGRHDGGH